MRFAVVISLVLLAACGGSVASTPTPSPAPSPTAEVVTAPPYVMATWPARPTPTPVPIHHAPPYLIAIDPGHGGPEYWGASARDTDGNLWIEKDLTLAVARRLQQMLTDSGYHTLLIRSEDATLTPWNAADYRGSMIAETQARVDRANEAGADLLLSIHFNGWVDSSQHGTEAYCNPDRSFGEENCRLAGFLQQALVQRIREAGYDVADRGVKNDGQVNGDPNNQHSFVLGTNAGFSPSLMPGAIAEALFLSNPDDLAFLRRDDAIDVIAGAFLDGVNAYFAWLNGQ